MRGEKGTGLCLVVQVLDDGPRNSQPIVCTGTAPDLVEDDETVACGVVQDHGRLFHLDHKRAFARGDVVFSPNTCKDAIHQANTSLLRRHEAADLGEQGDDGNLA